MLVNVYIAASVSQLKIKKCYANVVAFECELL